MPRSHRVSRFLVELLPVVNNIGFIDLLSPILWFDFFDGDRNRFFFALGNGDNVLNYCLGESSSVLLIFRARASRSHEAFFTPSVLKLNVTPSPTVLLGCEVFPSSPRPIRLSFRSWRCLIMPMAVSCYCVRTGVPPFYTQRHIPGNAADDVEMSMERHNSLPSKRVLT
jgi:hypothetical protein